MLFESLRRRKEFLVLFSFGCVSCMVWLGILLPRSRAFEAVVLDVGQGDSILVRTPSGRTILIDGGGHNTRQNGGTIGLKVVGAFLRRQGINRLDVVVLTHPHEDHVQGLTRVIRDFPVGLILDAGIPHPSSAYRDFLQVAERKHIRYVRAVRGQMLDFGDGVKVRVLNPRQPHLTGTEDDVNNNSIVLRATYGQRALLFMGDASTAAENDILASGEVVRADFLKVGHHGSKDATSQRWVCSVKPSVAVISVGRNNPFGHPSLEVLQRLRSSGVRIYRTDVNGAVTVRIDPCRFQVLPFRGVR